MPDVIPAGTARFGASGIILRGAGLAELWPSVVAMLALAIVLLVASSIRFARSTAS